MKKLYIIIDISGNGKFEFATPSSIPKNGTTTKNIELGDICPEENSGNNSSEKLTKTKEISNTGNESKFHKVVKQEQEQDIVLKGIRQSTTQIETTHTTIGCLNSLNRLELFKKNTNKRQMIHSIAYGPAEYTIRNKLKTRPSNKDFIQSCSDEEDEDMAQPNPGNLNSEIEFNAEKAYLARKRSLLQPRKEFRIGRRRFGRNTRNRWKRAARNRLQQMLRNSNYKKKNSRSSRNLDYDRFFGDDSSNNDNKLSINKEFKGKLIRLKNAIDEKLVRIYYFLTMRTKSVSQLYFL